MKKRVVSLVLVLLMVSMPIGFSSSELFSNVEVPRVSVEKDSERVSSEGLTRYVYGAGLVASVKDSEINYYHSDRIQSNRLVTDSSGSVEKEFKSLPFGQEISNSGVRYAFATGKELDESELYYFGARYYDSNLGRFTSVDPVPSEPAYQYVRNNPLNMIDPSGTKTDYNYYPGSPSLPRSNPRKDKTELEQLGEGIFKTGREQLEEDILDSLYSAVEKSERGIFVPCTAGACAVAEKSSSPLREPIINLLNEPKAQKQYENVFGEVIVNEGKIISSEDVKNFIFTELNWKDAQEFANKGGLVVALFHGNYVETDGEVSKTVGHTVIVAPNTESIRSKIDTSIYRGADKFNLYPIVFHTGAGSPRIVTLNWAFGSGKREQVRYVISTAEYNALNK